jgi:hypothetical protein
MISICSVSGESVAEAFFQAFGIFSIGLGAATIAFSLTPFTRDRLRTGHTYRESSSRRTSTSRASRSG